MDTVYVSASDRTLFHVAAEKLGDATQWWRLAQLNNLSDPSLANFSTPILLLIPPINLSLTDGLPNG